jgi:hypothetical protein
METQKTIPTEHTVKIVFEDEVRKYRNIASYNSLILAIARTMGYGVLNCRFVYTDDDNDEITVSNEEDLTEAFNFFNPKPPRLSLITYNQENNLALSEIKLCDSFAMEDNTDWELVERESVTSSKEQEVQGPVFFVEEVHVEELQTQHEEPKEEYKETIEYCDSIELETEPIDQKADRSVDQKSEVNDLTCEIQEDRIRPVIVVEKKEELKTFEELVFEELEEIEEPEMETEEKVELIDEAIESRIKIADDSLVNYTDLKSKVIHLAKEQLGILLPRILDECKSYVRNEHSIDESKKFKQIVHERIMCDNCKTAPIKGVRYHCVLCEDFDLCSDCELKNLHKHPMLKISSPEKYEEFLKELIRK